MFTRLPALPRSPDSEAFEIRVGRREDVDPPMRLARARVRNLIAVRMNAHDDAAASAKAIDVTIDLRPGAFPFERDDGREFDLRAPRDHSHGRFHRGHEARVIEPPEVSADGDLAFLRRRWDPAARVRADRFVRLTCGH